MSRPAPYRTAMTIETVRQPPSPSRALMTSRLFRALMCLATLPIVAAAPGDQERIRSVTDGDTFRLETGERIRIADIDAPETHRAQARCAAEVALGEVATARARTLLEHRDVTIARVGRSYNRSVARVSLNGRDLATQLVAIGVARWWPRYMPKPDWCGSSRQSGR